jgi:hypothetical protein
MFELPHSPLDVTILKGNSLTAGASWIPWVKPQRAREVHILIVGKGGAGGTGVVGTNSTAAGGGGGGSGAQTRLVVPAWAIPDVLYFSGGSAGTGTTIHSYLSIRPNTTANHTLAYAGGGGNGGNASGATGGTAGAAGGAATAALMPLGWSYPQLALGGQAGIAGGTTGSANTLTLPVTGLYVTGGTGGGGLPGAGVSGTNGGSFVVPAAPSPFPAHAGGQGSATATNPAARGIDGFENVVPGLLYNYGGTGGASTHGTATGGGLVQAAGGNGAPGCGGGGMGGALTGSSAATQSLGGAGFCVITVT